VTKPLRDQDHISPAGKRKQKLSQLSDKFFSTCIKHVCEFSVSWWKS